MFNNSAQSHLSKMTKRMLHRQLVKPGTVYRFTFSHPENNSLLVTAWSSKLNETTLQNNKAEDYDSVGAIYYVIAVIIMFGCTILLMFCSFVRKTHDDNSIISYMKDLDRLERLQLKQEKFRTNLQIHQKKVHRILGPDRAEVLDETQVFLYQFVFGIKRKNNVYVISETCVQIGCVCKEDQNDKPDRSLRMV